MITVENVTKSYNKKAQALKGVSFEIPTGVYGLIGRNGAGKTTLLKIMATVMKASSGQICLDGTPIDKQLKEYRAILGYLPQNTKLMPQLNIVEFLEYMCIIKGITDKNEIKIEVETTNLDEVREAIAAGADIIMLDNMDNATMTEAVAIIKGANPSIKTEASGNMNIPRLKEVAATGVDYISVGALTHTVKAMDISMNIMVD
jgi:ABC-type ATPase involved in cell division